MAEVVLPSGGACRSEVPTLGQRKKSMVIVAGLLAGRAGVGGGLTTGFDQASTLALNPITLHPVKEVWSLPPLAGETLTGS